MAYTTIQKVRDLTNGKLTEAKISDTILQGIISQAITQVNSEINVKVCNERIKYIDSWRKNSYNDGTSTTFYVKNGVCNYLADTDNSGTVDKDDIRVYKLNNEDVRTELTVSSIDIEDGSFTLSETPGTDTRELSATYTYTFYDVNTPDTIIELLTSYLAASWAYLSVDHSLGTRTKFGNIDFRNTEKGKASSQYMAQYETLLGRALIPGIKPKMGTSKCLI